MNHAKQLRKNMTDAERSLWRHLRSRQLSGHKFRRQQPLGPYIVDFVCLEKRLVIELNGDLETGKAMLRDYVNATLGFQELEDRTAIPAKSLMRMLGPKGSPSAANLSSILTALQKTEGVHFELSLRR